MCVIEPPPAEQENDPKDTQLCLVPPEPHTGSLVPRVGAAPTSALRQMRLDQRHADQQMHHHKQIWTKDAHGGPYRKAGNSNGYDPLTQTPDGRDKIMPLGYERTELGPTTNFVGNHMTQGAIDLVQADLDEDSTFPYPLLAAAPAPGPVLISSSPVHATRPPKLQPIKHYGWEEHEGWIRLSISLVIPASAATSAHLDGDIKEDSFRLALQHSKAGGSETISHTLAVPHLFGRITPERSHMELRHVDGHAERSSKAAPSMASPLHEACDSREASGSVQSDAPGRVWDVVARSSGNRSGHSLLILVQLAKRDPDQHWLSLAQEAQQQALSRQHQRGQDGLKLRQLRQAARQLRGRTQASAPAIEPPASALLLLQASHDAESLPPQPSQSSMQSCNAVAPEADAQATLSDAKGLMSKGDHASAAELLSGLLICQQSGKAVYAAAMSAHGPEVHLHLALCHSQAGNLKQAVTVCTEGLQCFQHAHGRSEHSTCQASIHNLDPAGSLQLETASTAEAHVSLQSASRADRRAADSSGASLEGASQSSPLLQRQEQFQGQLQAALRWHRAVALEQLECLDDSLQDLRWLRSQSTAHQKQAASGIERIMRAQQAQHQQSEAPAMSSSMLPSLPRRSLPAFQHRGKAGAVF